MNQISNGNNIMRRFCGRATLKIKCAANPLSSNVLEILACERLQFV